MAASQFTKNFQPGCCNFAGSSSFQETHAEWSLILQNRTTDQFLQFALLCLSSLLFGVLLRSDLLPFSGNVKSS